MYLQNRFKYLLVGFASLLFVTSIYSMKKQPLVPLNIIEGFTESYTSEELLLGEKDFVNIQDLCFASCAGNNEKLVYVATVGPPGAGKSTRLETWLSDKKNFVYIDPDQRTLRFMIYTYLQSLTCYNISKANSYSGLLEEAYMKWRGLSNNISNRLLNKAYEGGYNIAHGTTSTTSAIDKLYEKLKQKKYKIILLFCGSPLENREKARIHRTKNQGFFQATKEDTINKDKGFYENFPKYFKYADEIHFFWTEHFSDSPPEVAVHTRKDGLKIFDEKEMDKFKKDYEETCKNSKLELPVFDDLVKVK